MEQHIRGLEFRRMGCEMQLDKVKQASNHAIEELGNVKDLRNTDITSNSTDDRDYKANLWTSKFNIYNNRVKAIKDVYDTDTIKISAQTYLNTFYTNLGFSNIGEGYLEDGIPHIAMIKS